MNMDEWEQAIALERLKKQQKAVEQKQQKSTETDKGKQSETFKISKDDL